MSLINQNPAPMATATETNTPEHDSRTPEYAAKMAKLDPYFAASQDLQNAIDHPSWWTRIVSWVVKIWGKLWPKLM